MLKKVGFLGVEDETVVGTAETIVVGDGILAEDVEITYEPDMIERPVLREYPDPLAPIPGGAKASVKAKIPLKGSGTAGTTPGALADVLKSMGLNITTVAGYWEKYVPDSDLDAIGSATFKHFVGGASGKYITAKGVRGGGSFEIMAGQPGHVIYEGQGVFEAEGDGVTLASPADSPKPPIMVSADMYLLEVNTTTLHETLDGDVEKIQDGAASNVKLAITITGNNKKVKKIGLPLAKVGTPANQTNGIWLTIETDAAGDPSTTPLTNGTSDYISTVDICTTQEWVWFNFSTAPTLTNEATLHIVINSDYDTDADNCISVDTDVCVVGDQVCQYYDAAWADLSLKNIGVRILEATTTDLIFDGVKVSFNHALGVQVDPNDDNGYVYGTISDRKIMCETAPLEKVDSERDFKDYLTNATRLALLFTLGSTAGNKFKGVFTEVYQVKPLAWGEREGILTHPIELQSINPTRVEFKTF